MSSLLHDGHPFTAQMSSRLGLSPTLLRTRLREGHIRREFRNVFVDARVPDSRSGRLRALKLVAPANAVACDETAAWVRGIDVFAPGKRHDFIPALATGHGLGRVRHAGSQGRQAIIAAEDIEYVDGLHLTTPVRTVSDLLRRMYRPYALAAADSFAHAGLITGDEVIEYVAGLKGYRGIVQARSLAALIEARTQSPGESWQRLRMLDAGFPPPEPQFEVVDDSGRHSSSIFPTRSYSSPVSTTAQSFIRTQVIDRTINTDGTICPTCTGGGGSSERGSGSSEMTPPSRTSWARCWASSPSPGGGAGTESDPSPDRK